MGRLPLQTTKNCPYKPQKIAKAYTSAFFNPSARKYILPMAPLIIKTKKAKLKVRRPTNQKDPLRLLLAVQRGLLEARDVTPEQFLGCPGQRHARPDDKTADVLLELLLRFSLKVGS